jgi:hypothetical protein
MNMRLAANHSPGARNTDNKPLDKAIEATCFIRAAVEYFGLQDRRVMPSLNRFEDIAQIMEAHGKYLRISLLRFKTEFESLKRWIHTKLVHLLVKTSMAFAT